MNQAPGATYEVVFPLFEAGLTGIGTRVDDNLGNTVTAYDESNVSDLGGGVYAFVDRVAPTDKGQYTIILSVGEDGEVLGTEELNVTANAPDDSFTGDTYATVDELARILKIRAPSDEQTAAMERVMLAAAGEINSEIDLAEDTDLSGWQLALAAEVNLERAVEHWRQEEAPFGLIGLGAELGSAFTSKNSWERHALKLAPLKDRFGLA